MTPRMRDASTEWANKSPITDLHQFLELLARPTPWNEERFYVHRAQHEVHVAYYDMHTKLSGWYYFDVASVLMTDVLLEEYLEEYRRPPGVFINPTEGLIKGQMVLSEAGQDKLAMLNDQAMERARKIFLAWLPEEEREYASDIEPEMIRIPADDEHLHLGPLYGELHAIFRDGDPFPVMINVKTGQILYRPKK